MPPNFYSLDKMGDWGKFDGLEVLVSMLGSECDEYVQILKYIGPEYLLGHSFVSIFEYIRLFVQFSIQIFIRTYFIRMYSDIRSCKIFDTNIFGYLFVSKCS